MDKQKKTFVIMVSKKFSKDHPQRGIETQFVSKIIQGEKKHTIRGNYGFWMRRYTRINQGEAVLSVRTWEGMPYRSKQIEIARYEKINVQAVSIVKETKSSPPEAYIRAMRKIDIATLAQNDGLSLIDFDYWFFKEKTAFHGCIIWFGEGRY